MAKVAFGTPASSSVPAERKLPIDNKVAHKVRKIASDTGVPYLYQRRARKPHFERRLRSA
jgi:hypothetical protein